MTDEKIIFIGSCLIFCVMVAGLLAHLGVIAYEYLMEQNGD